MENCLARTIQQQQGGSEIEPRRFERGVEGREGILVEVKAILAPQFKLQSVKMWNLCV